MDEKIRSKRLTSYTVKIAGGSTSWISTNVFNSDFHAAITNLYEYLARIFDKPLINAFKMEGYKADTNLIVDRPTKGEDFIGDILGPSNHCMQQSDTHVLILLLMVGGINGF